MTPKLSILVPGIRHYNWHKFHASALEATKEPFEIIFCGPQPCDDLPPNTKFIKDLGSPVRCSQICLLAAIGEFIIMVADDCVFIESSLDKMLQTVQDKSIEVSCIAKYYEGDNDEKVYMDDSYYYLNTHASLRTRLTVKHNWLIGNHMLCSRIYAISGFGGLNMAFEGTAMAYSDLALRMQYRGGRIILCQFPVMRCDQFVGPTGDHAPVHFAQITHDEPLYRRINMGPRLITRVHPSWEQAPAVWSRRFN